MMTIVLIALAAALRRRWMFRLDHIRRADLAGAVLSGAAAADGGWPRMGTAQRTIGGISAALGLGAVFGLPYCLAFVLTIALPGLVARTSRIAGTARRHGHISRQTGRRPAALAMEMVPDRPHLAVDRRLRRADHHGGLFTLGSDAATIESALRRGLLRIVGRARLRRQLPATPTNSSMRWVTIAPAAGRCCRNDDADAQSLAGREDHRDLGPAAPPMARY